jgi:hypothetical protein
MCTTNRAAHYLFWEIVQKVCPKWTTDRSRSSGASITQNFCFHEIYVLESVQKIIYYRLQINIWRDRTFVRSLLILVGHNLNLVGQKPTPLNLVGHIYVTRYIYKSRDKYRSMYSHSGTTLSKMLECLVNFIAKCKLSKFAIVFCHSKKMYNVTTFFLWSDQCPIKITFARTFAKCSQTLSDVRQ